MGPYLQWTLTYNGLLLTMDPYLQCAPNYNGPLLTMGSYLQWALTYIQWALTYNGLLVVNGLPPSQANLSYVLSSGVSQRSSRPR